ncbi:MAG: hypothetical protein WAW86_02245, partial [Gammaproteobacteria bacterium]
GNNNVAITNAIALSLGASSVGSGALDLTGLGVSQTGSMTQAASAGLVTINAGAGAIDLSNAANTFTNAVSLNNSGANDVQLTDTTALVLGTSHVGSGALSLTSGGSISQTGPLVQEASAGILTFTFMAPDSDLLFASQPNDLTGFLNIGGTLGNLRDVEFRNVGVGGAAIINLQLLTSLRNLTVIMDNTVDTALPALTLHNGGNLILDTSGSLSGGTGGSISQTGALTVPGTSSFNAGSHAITLTEANNFTGAVTLNNSGNNNVALTNNLALNFAASSIGSGTLTLTGAGVSQIGTIMQGANAGVVTINAGANAITLGDSGNSFTGAVSFNNSGANNIVLANSGTLILGTSSIGSGTLSLTAGGSMNQTGSITQAANAGTITLNNLGNADMIFNQANDLNGAIVFGGNVDSIHDVSLRNTNVASILPTNLSSLSNLTDLTIVFDNAGINLPTLSLHSGGSLSINTGGDITQTGALTIPGTSSFNAGAHSITLTQNNNFSGAVSLNNTGNNNVSITNSGLLQLDASSMGGGTLALTGLGVSQIGAITQAASAGLVTVNAGADLINLSNAGNHFTGVISLNNNGNDNVSLANNTALILGTSNVGSGTLALAAGGTISQTGAITQTANAGTVTLSVSSPLSDILLASQANDFSGALAYGGTASNIRDIGLRNINSNAGMLSNLTSASNLRNLTLLFDNAAIILPTLTMSGDLIANAGGTITQSGAISGSDLTTTSVGGTTLNNANSFSSFTGTNTTSGDIALSNSSSLLTIGDINESNGDIIISNTGAIAINGLMSASGDVALTGTGAINETGTGTISGGLLTTSSVGGTILTNNNSITGFNAANSGSGNIQLVNTAEPLTISGITQVNSGHVIVLNTGALTTTGAINTNGGDVTMQTLSPDSTARLLTVGAEGIATTGGSIDLNAANPDDQLFALAINGVLNTSPGTGGVFTINPGVRITATPIVGAGNITLNGNGLDFIGGNITVISDFVLRAPRNIILIGPVNTINGSSFSLLADDDHNGIGGVLIQNGGYLDATGNLVLQGSDLSTATGALDVNAGVEIQTGAFVRSTANIALLGNIGSNADININGNVQVTNPGSTITITPAGTGVIKLGANVLSQGGAIDFNGPLNVVNSATVDSGLGGGAINFNNSVAGISQILTLQNNTAADGAVTFNGNVTLAGLITFTQPYSIVFNGASNTFANAVTFNNTNGITLGSNTSDIFHFNGGLTSTNSETTLASTVNTNGADLNLDVVTLSGNSTLNSANGAITLGMVNSNSAGTNNLTLNSGTGTVNLNGVIGSIIPFNNLTVAGSGIDINTSSITTNGSQTYNAPVLFSTDATLMGGNIAFNNGVSGDSLSLIGQAGGNNNFSLAGPLQFNSINITGNTTGNNSLAMNSGGQTWNINSNNAGSVAIAGIAPAVNFSRIQNLIGGIYNDNFIFADNTAVSGTVNGGTIGNSINTLTYSNYTTPISAVLSSINAGIINNNSARTITTFDNINSLMSTNNLNNEITLPNKSNSMIVSNALVGSINDPIFFDGFQTFRSISGTDSVIFGVPATINSLTQTAVINGITMYFINFHLGSPTPTPTPTPIPPSSIPNVSAIIQQGNNPPSSLVNMISNNGQLLIEDQMQAAMNAEINFYNNEFIINLLCSSTSPDWDACKKAEKLNLGRAYMIHY